jgi:hypothetical protein
MVDVASLSLFKQTQYIHSTFDVGRSMFDVHQFLFRLNWPFFGQRRRLYETTPKWRGFLMIRPAAFQAGGGARIRTTADDYSLQTHEKNRKYSF